MTIIMQDFITGLQFLTRIRIVNQSEWSAESFGRSVKFFPVVGSVLGLILAGISYILLTCLPALGVNLSPHIIATLILIGSILLTGGLHCDGFMDTADGVFSGRTREKMLEIMKDSRIGANGVVAFVLLALLKWSLLQDIASAEITAALFIMPVMGRLAMVIGITLFPYARPEGIGKSFAKYANKQSLLIAGAFSIALAVFLGLKAIVAAVAAGIFALIIGKYITKVLGGLTGDVYGAITELTEVVVLVIFLF